MAEPDNMNGNLVKVLEWLRYLLPRVDSALVTIDHNAASIHRGDHFTAHVYDADVDVVGPKYISIVTPDATTCFYLHAQISGSAGFFWELYEDPTIDATGALVTIFNNDRNSGAASTAVVRQDCTTQAPNNDGTLLISGYSGGPKAAGAGGILEAWELMRNQTYILKVTAVANDLKLSITPAWQEET